MATKQVDRSTSHYDPNEKVVVDLARDYAYPSGGPVYGPGEDVEVPRGLADALGLKAKEGAKPRLKAETGEEFQRRLQQKQAGEAPKPTATVGGGTVSSAPAPAPAGGPEGATGTGKARRSTSRKR